MEFDRLVLGPLLRHTDRTSATVWVETRDAAQVTVHALGRSWSAGTFRVHGHHYALVAVDGLEPGTMAPYSVSVDGTAAWPPDDSDLPPSLLHTADRDRRPRILFGSCRTSVPHDAGGNRTHGVDALRAYALWLAEDTDRPMIDLLLLLGDQVYADETTEEIRSFIEARRNPDEPPGWELKDYQEYAELYRLSWTEPVIRWLLSTVPSAMIFDDHDIRDDWNTSATWKKEMEATSWWHGRIVSGLASYWVYQHLGNLAPEERAKDEIWQQVGEYGGPGEPDLSDALDELAGRVDQHPETYRWSYARELDDMRLVVVDSRAARVLDPGRRSLLDDGELAWLDEQMRGDVRHLLVGTSLPFLLARGLHQFEAWSEAVAGGAWGRRAAPWAERLRQRFDLEHWAAFQHGFQEVAAMALSVARGERGQAPETIAFLSGDVHHSYVSEVTRARDGHPTPLRSRIVQVVCSPIRNPLPRFMRFATAAASFGVGGVGGTLVARTARTAPPPIHWEKVLSPWYDNNIGLLSVTDQGLAVTWHTGVVEGGDHAHPRLEQVAAIHL